MYPTDLPHLISARAALAAAAFATTMLAASAALAATAAMKGPDGADLGTLELTETPNGVILKGELHDLPEGAHGFHIHETGACAPDFSAAGGHFQGGGDTHGVLVDAGPHAGDMANIHVPSTGRLMIEAINPYVSLEVSDEGLLLDDDGAALIIHSGADDYESQPSGDAGERIACGVIEE